MIIQLHRQANERRQPLEPAHGPMGTKHGRSGINASGAQAVEDKKKKIVVKRAGSHVLVPNEEDVEKLDVDEADLDLLSECFG
jgi:hypothetical protein